MKCAGAAHDIWAAPVACTETDGLFLLDYRVGDAVVQRPGVHAPGLGDVLLGVGDGLLPHGLQRGLHGRFQLFQDLAAVVNDLNVGHLPSLPTPILGTKLSDNNRQQAYLVRQYKRAHFATR